MAAAAQTVTLPGYSNPNVSNSWLYNNKMRWAGAWASGTTYGPQDVVTYGGVGYVSLAAGNLNQAPAPGGTAYWAVLPTSTGAADWVSQVTNKPQFDARSYGVKCDGSTDDTTAMQSAITASMGGALLLPAGTCVVSSGWTIPDGSFSIQGAGKALTKLYPSTGFPDNSALFNVTGSVAPAAVERKISGLTVDFAQPDISKQISSLVVSGASPNTVVNTTAAHGYHPGDVVIIFNIVAPVDLKFNGRFTVVATPTSTQFTIATSGIANGTYSPALGYVQSKASLKKWTAINATSGFVNGLTVSDVLITGAWNGIAFKGAFSAGWIATVSEGKFDNVSISNYNRGMDIDGMLGTSNITNTGCSAAYQSARGGTPGGYARLQSDISTICFKVGRADDLKITRSGAGINGTGIQVTTSDGGDTRTAWLTVTDCIFDGETGLDIEPATADSFTPHVRVDNSYFYLVGEGAATYSNRPVHRPIIFTGGFLQVTGGYFMPSTADTTAIGPIKIQYPLVGSQNTSIFTGVRFTEYQGITTDQPFLVQYDSFAPGSVSIVGGSISRYGAGAYSTPAFDFQQSGPSSVQAVFTGMSANRIGGTSQLYKFVKDDNHIATGNSFHWDTGTSTGWKTQYVYSGAGQYQPWDATIDQPVFLGPFRTQSASGGAGFYMRALSDGSAQFVNNLFGAVTFTVYNNGMIAIANAPVYANNAAALAGGMTANQVYRNSTGALAIVY